VANKWFSECAPCRWQETHDTQDAAIVAAQEHVVDAHRDLFSLPGDERSRKMVSDRIGHVQLRDENTIGAGMSAGSESLAVTDTASRTDAELQAEEKQLLERLATIDRERAVREAERRAGV